LSEALLDVGVITGSRQQVMYYLNKLSKERVLGIALIHSKVQPVQNRNLEHGKSSWLETK